MDLFGIGPLELVVILVVAFLVLGPHRFREMARKTGKFVHELRKMGSEFTSLLNEEIEDKAKSKKGER